MACSPSKELFVSDVQAVDPEAELFPGQGMVEVHEDVIFPHLYHGAREGSALFQRNPKTHAHLKGVQPLETTYVHPVA